MTRILSVTLIGLVLRLGVSWVAADMAPVADMAQYHEGAVFMRDHLAFGPDALRGPGYPALLAAA